MSESAGAAFGFGQIQQGGNLLPSDLGETGDDHLGNAFAGLDFEGLLGEVDQQHLNFTPVVCVNGAGAVEHRDAMFGGQAAARAYLRLAALRKFQKKTRGDEFSFAGGEHNFLLQISAQVQARSMYGLVGRERITGGVKNLANAIFHK